MGNFFWKAGALNGALAVALGAFGAHGLKSRVKDERMLAAWSTAAQYHLVHSVVLLAVPLVKPVPTWGGRLLLGGITLFGGSLYAMVLSDVRALGAITPVGGTALIGGWLCLAMGV